MVPTMIPPKSTVIPLQWLSKPATSSKKAATAVRVSFKAGYDQVINQPREPDNAGSDTNADDDLDVDNDDDDTLQESPVNSNDHPHEKQYQRGPLPCELVDKVQAITDAFECTLAKTAKKYNCPLHTVCCLANIEGIHSTHSPNPFNGYAQKCKLAGLPQCKMHIVQDIGQD